MKFLFYLFLCICVLHVSAGAIIEKVKAGAHQAKQTIHCGFHKVKNFFVQHNHTMDPCQKGAASDHNNDDKVHDMDERGLEETTTIDPRVLEEETISSNSTRPRGRRLINVGSNCPPGYRSDNRGNCREEY